MPTEDLRLADALRKDFPGDPAPPPFDAAIEAAEQASGRSRRRRSGATAAALVAAAGFAALYPSLAPQTTDTLVGDALMSSTRWSAPSDVLLPQRDFDVYRELPALDLSTKPDDGALL